MKMEEFKRDGYSISVKRVKEVYYDVNLDANEEIFEGEWENESAVEYMIHDEYGDVVYSGLRSLEDVYSQIDDMPDSRDVLDYDIEYTKMDGHVVREFLVGEPMKIKGEINESILVDGHKVEVIDIGNHYSKDWEENFDEFGQWAFDSLEEVLDMIDDDSNFITFLELSALVKSEREEGNYFIVTFDFFESGE